MTIPAVPMDVNPDPATDLLTIGDLAVWLDVDPSTLTDDMMAAMFITAASDRVRSAASQPTWTAATAPARARQIASHLAYRSYINPDSIVAPGSLGPLGGDRTVEELAKALHLTQAELDELAGMSPVATGASGSNGLWVQAIDPISPSVRSADVYLPDSLGGNWWVPYLHPDDLQALG